MAAIECILCRYCRVSWSVGAFRVSYTYPINLGILSGLFDQFDIIINFNLFI